MRDNYMGFFGKIGKALKERREKKKTDERKAMQNLARRVSKLEPSAPKPKHEAMPGVPRRAQLKAMQLGNIKEKVQPVMRKRTEKIKTRTELLKNGTNAMIAKIEDIRHLVISVRALGAEAAITKGVTKFAVQTSSHEIVSALKQEFPGKTQTVLRPDGNMYVIFNVPNKYRGKVLDMGKKLVLMH